MTFPGLNKLDSTLRSFIVVKKLKARNAVGSVTILSLAITHRHRQETLSLIAFITATRLCSKGVSMKWTFRRKSDATGCRFVAISTTARRSFFEVATRVLIMLQWLKSQCGKNRTCWACPASIFPSTTFRTACRKVGTQSHAFYSWSQRQQRSTWTKVSLFKQLRFLGNLIRFYLSHSLLGRLFWHPHEVHGLATNGKFSDWTGHDLFKTVARFKSALRFNQTLSGAEWHSVLRKRHENCFAMSRATMQRNIWDLWCESKY